MLASMLTVGDHASQEQGGDANGAWRMRKHAFMHFM